VKYADLQKENNALMSSGAAGLGTSAAAAAKKAADFGFTDTFDTTGLRENMGKVVQGIKDAMPKPEAVKQAAAAVGKTDTNASVSPQATRLDPIVTSLGKVGGGGYSSGTLDAQRENNRLTGETNRLLTRMDQKLGKYGTGLAAFG
jgi:hypothetical protein